MLTFALMPDELYKGNGAGLVAADDYGGDVDDDEEEEPFNERKWFDYGGRCASLGLVSPPIGEVKPLLLKAP